MTKPSAANPFGITSRSSVLFVDAHPGSAVRHCGAVMRRAINAGARVSRLIACDGAAMFDEDRGPALAAQRVDEEHAGLAWIGVPLENITFLGFPDGGLEPLRHDYWRLEGLAYFDPWLGTDRVTAEHASRPGTPFFGESFFALVGEVIYLTSPTHIFTHSSRDRHSDHRALNWFVKRAAADALADGLLDSPPAVFEWLTYHTRVKWPPPGRIIPLAAARRLPVTGECVDFRPTRAEVRIKAQAWRCHLPSHGSAYVNRWMKENEIFWRTSVFDL